MAEVLAWLYYLTGEADYRDQCERLIDAFSGEAAKNAYSHVTLINAAQFLAEATQLVFIGGPDDADSRDLMAVLNRVTGRSARHR